MYLSKGKSMHANRLDIEKIIESIIEVLKSQEDFFKEEIERLNKLRLTNTIRIGLVGITSTGKSTLLNTFMGEDILPRNVRPTSNVLVLCKKGSKKYLKVFFEDGNTELIEEKSIKDKLSKYADERFNSKNEFKVKEIHLYHPNFIFGEQVEIIDSPGLDAYGLENHEKITLSVMLPTLDYVFYLTTMKATTDEKNLEFLSQIVKFNIEFLIIQNMRDSVEPKIGKGGVIEKTTEQLLREHENRVRKIISKVDEDLSNKTRIIQISALWALNDRNKDSNIGELIEYVKNLISTSNYIWKKSRFNQILKVLDDLINKEDLLKKDRENFERQENEINYLKINLEEFKEIYKKKIREVEDKFLTIIGILSNAIQQIISLSDQSLNFAENFIQNVNRSLNNEIDLSMKSIIKLYDFINSKIKIYNINVSDIREYLYSQNFSLYIDINVRYKNIRKQKEYWVEKEGFFNKIKRFLGDIFDEKSWGREKQVETYYEKILDKDSIIQNLHYQISKLESSFNFAIEKLENYFKSAHDRCNEIILNKEQSLENKLKLIPSMSKDKIHLLLQTFERLKSLKTKIRQETNIKNNFSLLTKELKFDTDKFKMIKIDRIFINFLSFADAFINSYFRAIGQYCLSLINNSQKNIYFFGYEIQKIEDIFEKLFNKRINLNCGSKEFKINEIINVYFDIPYFNINNSLYDKDIIIKKSELFFIMIDILQIGSTENKLYNLDLIRKIKDEKKKLIVVIDEIKSLLENNSLSEALIELFGVLNRLNIRPVLFIVNDYSPIYSIAISKMFEIIEDEKIISEQNFIRELKNICGPIITIDGEKRLGKILREIKMMRMEVRDEK